VNGFTLSVFYSNLNLRKILKKTFLLNRSKVGWNIPRSRNVEASNSKPDQTAAEPSNKKFAPDLSTNTETYPDASKNNVETTSDESMNNIETASEVSKNIDKTNPDLSKNNIETVSDVTLNGGKTTQNVSTNNVETSGDDSTLKSQAAGLTPKVIVKR
jgi:hypothetical protein